MAASKQFVRSVDKASEEYHEFVCSPCATDDRNIGAVKYCTQCKEYLCPKCIKDHNRFAALKVHKLLDVADLTGQQAIPGKFIPMEQCTVHLGNNLEIYCGNHDVVCCPTCVSLNHRSCVDITYIIDAARGVTESQEYKSMKHSIGEVKSKLEQMKKIKQDNQTSFENSKRICLTQIKDFRKKINKHLDDLELAARNEVDMKYKKYEDNVDSDIKILEEIIATLETSISKMKKVNKDNEQQVFVYTKMSKQNQKKGQQLLQEMKNTSKPEPVIYKINTAMEDIIKNFKSLGEFEEPDKEDQLYKAIPMGRYDVKVAGESYWHILGSCLLPDGKLLITDNTNKKLKLLDQTYKVTDWCNLSGWPYGVCTTDPGEAAVVFRLNMKIQFVTLGQRMIPTSTLEVGHNCYGVGYINGQLIVSCRSPGLINIYNKAGKLLRTFHKDTAGQQLLTSPRNMALSMDGTLVHVADGNNGVITLDLQGNKLSQFSDPSLVNAWDVCPGVGGQIFVCGRDSHNVIQISHGGQKLDEILDQSNGIENPASLCYDSVNSRLIVTMQSDHIIVFKLAKK